MDKLRMESPDMTAQNIDRIAALFPNCVTEASDGHGGIKRAINFELLKQMLSPDVVDGDECYEFTWVGKKAAIVEANKPIRKTLRPCVEESKNWDTTENLYIEGDNLEVLKLLQESYLGKVKMIYIDPPYNTGNDFIYADDFMRSQEEEDEESGRIIRDEDGKKIRTFTDPSIPVWERSEDGEAVCLFRNTDSNARFHSDWCSMIYSRLMLARNLLTDDGAIFISIDDNEQENLKKICDEVFGSTNYVATFPWRKRTAKSDVPFGVSQDYEWIICYAKSDDFIASVAGKDRKYYETPDFPGRPWRIHDLTTQRTALERPNSNFAIINPQNGISYPVNPQAVWRITEEGFPRYLKENRIVFPGDYDFLKISKPVLRYWKEDDMAKAGESFGRVAVSTKFPDNIGMSQDGTKEISELFSSKVFSFPKPTSLVKFLMHMHTSGDDIILDFFSGSATTAHAVMQLNAEDGGHRKFIMVQLPEPCDEKSEAYKAGYKTICEIGKERIRRAGEKIKSEIDVVHKDDYAALVQSQQSNDQKVMTGFDSLKSSGVLTEKGYTYMDKDTKDISRITYSAEDPNDFYRFHPNALDVGFRVLKLDDTNMKDVYYAPDDYDQGMLAAMESNIKDDRTDLDLLFGCLIDWGLPLSLPYKSEQIDGCTVHTYNDGDLIACFDANIPESVVKEIAKRKPLRAVFRDSGFASSPEKINVFEIFKLYMPEDANDITKRVRVI